MAIVICEKHGRTGAAMVCRHAAHSIKTGAHVATTEVKTNDFMIPVVNLCSACLPEWPALGDEEVQMDFICTLTLECYKCLDEMKGKSPEPA